MAKEQVANVAVLTDKLDNMYITPKVKFVVNPIIYADGEESDVSSDEEYDSSEELQFDELDTGDKLTLPYRPYRIKESKAIATSGKMTILTPVGFTKGQKLLQVNPNIVEELGKSTVVQPFLDNLYNTGLESEDDRHIEQLVSASICLNRPLSLSTRKNNLLMKELNAQSESSIVHNKFGIFWSFRWYNAENSLVEYNVVRTFYKKLKHYDLIHETSKAEEFRAICDSGIAPPYQELREIAKNHSNTKALVTASRTENPNADVYLSFVDGDTQSFNGIYSAYVRIHKAAIVKPSVMTTGYEFTKEQEGDHTFVEGSRLDRLIRVATNKHVKCGVYFPEPNFCVVVMPGAMTVTESFIDKTIKASGVIIKNAESVALMRNLINSRGHETFEVIFSDDNPLLTTIPNRVRLTKSAKTSIKFSNEFVIGLGPTAKDLVSFKQMSQSHVHEGVWIDNLSINRAIILKKGFHFQFKGLLTKYLKSSITSSEQTLLLQIISPEDLTMVKNAYIAREKVIQTYEDENLRNANQQGLIDFINEDGELEIDDFDTDFLQILANADIIALLEEDILDLEELNAIPTNVLKELLYEASVIEKLAEETITFQQLLEIYYAVKKQNAIFSDVFEDFVDAINNGELSVSEITERYIEDSMHLMFISGDPTDIVLENSEDELIVIFGIENYDVDVEWIREELGAERDDVSAALMDFDRMIGVYDDYDNDQFLGNHEDYNEYES